MHKTVNADGKRILTSAQCARNINNKQNIENIFNFRRSEQCTTFVEINIFLFPLFTQRTQNETLTNQRYRITGRHCTNILYIHYHTSPTFMRFDVNATEKEEEEAKIKNNFNTKQNPN